MGVKLGIVQKSGAWFNYGDIRLGQGRDNAKQFLKDCLLYTSDADRRIILQGAAAGGNFGVAVDDTHLLAQLVDEDTDRVGLADDAGQLARCV